MGSSLWPQTWLPLMVPLVYGAYVNCGKNAMHIGCCHTVLTVTIGCMYLGGLFFLIALLVTYPLSLLPRDDPIPHVSRNLLALAAAMLAHRAWGEFHNSRWQATIADYEKLDNVRFVLSEQGNHGEPAPGKV